MTWLRAMFLAATACGGGGGFPDAPPEPDARPNGTLSVAWNLVKMADGTPVACDPVGGQGVTLLLRNRAFQGGSTEAFSCNSKMGTTPQIPVGTYDVKFELNGISGLIATGAEQMGFEVTAGNDTALDPVTFTVDATGKVALKIDALKAGGNCAAAPNGGGITGTTITLNHASGGACEPAVLTLTPAVGAPTTYTINCTTPVVTGCIESTTAITATVPADNYQIHVRGRQAANECFINDDSIRVPPNSGTLTRTLNLAATSGAGCL